ncbi:MAG TPA: penicillin-binding protein 1C [Bacteroidia bacterium]|nr:penicillin-binding protein 1C [Bacteroidia bacterium]
MRAKKKVTLILVVTALLVWFVFCLPSPLFNDPNSTVLEDASGNLLAAKITSDGQWRFPQPDSIPEKFAVAVTLFEDEYFYYHPGINPVSLFRAIRQNIIAGKTISGGSTITMQTIRLSRKGRHRTIPEKLIEMIQAVRLECSVSKKQILNYYTSHAPYGGNVVGLDAAAWRYYNRRPDQLSWAETASLAVLPNAPSFIFPGKNTSRYKKKRDRLLDKLCSRKIIDRETCELSKAEPLPGTPFPIPSSTPHLLARAVKEGLSGKRVHTTIDGALQEKVNRIVDDYHGVLSQNEIHNIAAIILNVKNGTVLAYTGNTNCPDENSGKDVDVILAPRSSGSILKPFLYASMLQDGALLPGMLVPDIPTQIGGYAPKNFEETFDGAVPASEALARSLNVPAVRMLQEYGQEKFYQQLRNMQFPTIDMPAAHYGLSIILGGAEVTLWDLTNEYLRMAQSLEGVHPLTEASYVYSESINQGKKESYSRQFDDAAIWLTFEALSTLNRPWQETGWEEFQSSQKVAWKTGTSFGHRDAWSIGVTPEYVVGIWTGNADGEGRPGLTGVSVASPIMFKIFKLLNTGSWFEKPLHGFKQARVCAKSGFLASDACDSVITIQVPERGVQTPVCPYHEIIHLDKSRTYRVNSDCYPVYDMVTEKWFVLPPVQEWYYRRKDPSYKILPPMMNGCASESIKNMAVIYPRASAKIFIPRELDGKPGKTVFEIAHRLRDIAVYWHLDDQFMGTTIGTHRIELNPAPGIHHITAVDANGETLSWRFEILEK